MARTVKKEKVLSAEEKLQQALVPVDEQPYPVPKNWCWTYLSSMVASSKDKTEDFSNPSVKYVGLENMEKDAGIVSIGSSNGIKSLKNVFSPDQILYGKLRPYLNKHDVASFSGICSTDILVFNSRQSADSKFINYFLDLPFFIDYAVANSKGINLPRVSENVVMKAPCPLPPLAEQHRIVSRIESLFAKLDEAREKAQAVVDGFEDRKAAILHKAFTGELSSQWRIKHNLTKDSWKECRLSEISTLQTGLMKGKRYSGKTVWRPYLRVANVQDGYLNLKEIKQIEVEESNLNRYLLQYGDVLFTEGGDYDKLGRGTVWHGEVKDCLHQNHVFVVRPNPNMLLPEFLSLQAGSQYGKRYFLSCSKQTTNLASINSTQLKNFPVLLPTIEEQRQIIGMVQNLLTVLEKSKDGVNNTLSQIDSIKKSILARAFRGTLGTNDPSDESAEELLKRIL